jgi:hypothetical protein
MIPLFQANCTEAMKESSYPEGQASMQKAAQDAAKIQQIAQTQGERAAAAAAADLRKYHILFYHYLMSPIHPTLNFHSPNVSQPFLLSCHHAILYQAYVLVANE